MSPPKGTNLTWHGGEVTGEDRARRHGHRGATLWMTGLSGAGKSTVAYRVERKLVERGAFAYVLDGDNVRHGLNSDLGFAPGDRDENIRRVGEVCRLFADAGAIVLASFISPYRSVRKSVRDKMPPGTFLEVYVSASLEVCESRDPKGLYKRARAGEIPDFTGISAPYEPPENPEIEVNTGELDVDACADQIIAHLETHGILMRR